MSVRSTNCLVRKEVTTIGELIKHTTGDLLKFPNLGKTCMREIKQYLTERGLKLSDS